MIEMINVKKSFGEHQVLKGISAVFEEGKCNLIIGKSGSGKTVTLKCLVGLFEPDEGSILYDNRDITKMDFDEKKKIRQEFGMLFQGTALFDSLTVEENIRFPLDMFTDMSDAEKKERVNFCLQKVNMSGTNKKYPGELSGGMKKRVGIARAIVNNPKYLFCDEPNSGLDPKTALIIDRLIKELTEEYNMTTVINTHDMNSVMSIGDKVIFLHEGIKYWEGTNKEILEITSGELFDFIFASDFLKELRMRAKF
ncbi:MAG: ATP-binding cassette domain-containing protein [Chitinophagales bacterium]|nr:ATP-binding cassette domain-containing protein [Chitinophagales bacterium]MDW8272696.1 ATP-binding cassette domain-containing protein [Chitinophagales bacterium]